MVELKILDYIFCCCDNFNISYSFSCFRIQWLIKWLILDSIDFYFMVELLINFFLWVIKLFECIIDELYKYNIFMDLNQWWIQNVGLC